MGGISSFTNNFLSVWNFLPQSLLELFLGLEKPRQKCFATNHTSAVFVVLIAVGSKKKAARLFSHSTQTQ